MSNVIEMLVSEMSEERKAETRKEVEAGRGVSLTCGKHTSYVVFPDEKNALACYKDLVTAVRLNGQEDDPLAVLAALFGGAAPPSSDDADPNSKIEELDDDGKAKEEEADPK